jgi:hypothetical protein
MHEPSMQAMLILAVRDFRKLRIGPAFHKIQDAGRLLNKT